MIIVLIFYSTYRAAVQAEVLGLDGAALVAQPGQLVGGVQRHGVLLARPGHGQLDQEQLQRPAQAPHVRA